MTRTSYQTQNIALLIVGTLMSLFVSVLSMGLGALGDGLRNQIALGFVLLGELSFPTFALMYRWSSLGLKLMSGLLALWLLFAIVSGKILDFILVALVLLILTAICSVIDSNSREDM